MGRNRGFEALNERKRRMEDETNRGMHGEKRRGVEEGKKCIANRVKNRNGVNEDRNRGM